MLIVWGGFARAAMPAAVVGKAIGSAVGHLERLLRGCVRKWAAWPVMLASGGPT